MLLTMISSVNSSRRRGESTQRHPPGAAGPPAAAAPPPMTSSQQLNSRQAAAAADGEQRFGSQPTPTSIPQASLVVVPPCWALPTFLLAVAINGPQRASSTLLAALRGCYLRRAATVADGALPRGGVQQHLKERIPPPLLR